jgi:RNA polymerase sigma-70 factor (ECF subfamily)
MTLQTMQSVSQEAITNRTSAPEREDQALLLGVVPEAIDKAEWRDEDLIRAVGRGDTAALETLYDRHVRGCFGLSMKVVRDPLVAEEVVQDVFTKLWSAPQSFSPERGKFSGWLLTLVYNRSVDKLRRMRAHLGHVSLPMDADGAGDQEVTAIVADTGPGPDEMAWRKERGVILSGYLGKLPEEQRQAITMAYFEGLTQREIAERLRQPLGTVKTRTRAALAKMRQLLAGQELMGEL